MCGKKGNLERRGAKGRGGRCVGKGEKERGRPWARRAMSGVTVQASPEKRHRRPYSPRGPPAPARSPWGSLPFTAISTALLRVPCRPQLRFLRRRLAILATQRVGGPASPFDEGGVAPMWRRQAR